MKCFGPILVVTILLVPKYSLGQEQISEKPKQVVKGSFGIAGAINYNLVSYRDKIKPPSPGTSPFSVSNRFTGFRYRNSLSYKFSIIYNLVRKKTVFFTGIQYTNRRVILESDSNSVKKFQNRGGYTSNKIIRYQYRPVGIEVPIYLGFQGGKGFFYFGGSFNIFYFYIMETIVDFDNNQFNTKIPSNAYSFRSFFYPGFVFKRNIKRIEFFGLLEMRNLNSHDLQMGIIYNLTK